MSRELKLTLTFFVFGLFGFLFASAFFVPEINKLEAENAALKMEVLEFQLKSYPAITARSWWSNSGVVSKAADITPEVLEYALNPCYLTPSGNWDNFNSGCGPAGKGQIIGIKIVASK